MGKERKSWMKSLKSVIRAHFHEGMDDEILRYPHLPHSKRPAQQNPVVTTIGSRITSPPLYPEATACSCASCKTKDSAPLETVVLSHHGSSRSFSFTDSSSRRSCSSDCGCDSRSKINHSYQKTVVPAPAAQQIGPDYDSDAESAVGDTIFTFG